MPDPLDFLSTITPTEVIPPDKGKTDDDANKGDNKSKKDESIAALRAARDAAIKEKEKEATARAALEERLKTLEGLKPLEKINSYLKAKKKKDVVEDEDVDEFIETAKERKKRLAAAEEIAKQKDLQIKELSIEQSDEWANEYAKPIEKVALNIYTTLSNVDGEGKVRQDELVRGLMQKIVTLDDPIKIKTELSLFRKQFEENSGLDYEMPSLKEVVSLVEEFQSKKKSAIEARKNWEKTREEKTKEEIYNSSLKEKEFIRKEVDARNYVFGKLSDGDEFKEASALVGDDAFKKAAQEEHEFMLKSLRKDSDYTPRGYEGLLSSLIKGKAFDSLAEKLKSVMSENDALKKKLSSEHQTEFRTPKPKDEQNKTTKKADPLAFLS